jgi:3'-phosphoadenosine 5'-phosphosulfate sulfotransferase
MDLSVEQLILCAVAFWFLTQVIFGILDAHKIMHLKMRLDTLKELNGLIHQVKIEKYNDMEYWFDQDSDQFLAQGKTIEEVIHNLKASYPNHIFLLKDVGGVAKLTDWKLLGPEEFQKIQFYIKDI